MMNSAEQADTLTASCHGLSVSLLYAPPKMLTLAIVCQLNDTERWQLRVTQGLPLRACVLFHMSTGSFGLLHCSQKMHFGCVCLRVCVCVSKHRCKSMVVC